MREYYARFFREVRKSMFLFWKQQVVWGLVTGVINAVLNVRSGVTPGNFATVSIKAVVIGYMVVFGVALICSVICAPVNLDRRRVVEIDVKESSISRGLSEIEALKSGIKTQAVAKQSEIAALEERLSRKHPHDEQQEAKISRALAELDPKQRKAFTWLLDAGEVSRGVLQSRGLDADYFFRRDDFPPLLAYRSHSPGNGTIELDRFYYINPNMANSLRNVLYPTSRPVAPLQA